MYPEGADEAYQTARAELARAEKALSEQTERVAAARRALPPGPVLGDYALHTADGEPIGLGDLFGAHRTLFLYHLMFAPDAAEACPMCSMWVDGLHGVAHHLARHTAFAVVAKAPPARLRAWGRHRGWAGLTLVSSFGTTFNADLRAETPEGDQRPMVSVLTRDDDGSVRHRYSQPANFTDGSERGIDPLSPVWNVLDLLPQGRGEWYAENGYAGSTRG